VPRSLDRAAEVARHTDEVGEIVAAARAVVDTEALARLEYTTVFDADTLEEVTELSAELRRPDRVRIATAVWFGATRLIDNRDLFGAR
jgi:pantothenate synthetase